MDETRACGVRVEPNDPPDRSTLRRGSHVTAARLILLLGIVWGFVAWGLAADSPSRPSARMRDGAGVPLVKRQVSVRPTFPSLHAEESRPSLSSPALDLRSDRWKDSFFASSFPASEAAVSVQTTRESAVDVDAAESLALEIRDIQVEGLRSSSATIKWQTSESVASRVAYGFDVPTLWTLSSLSVEHTATVDGLLPEHTYRVWITAHAEDGRTVEADAVLTTPARSGPVDSTTIGDSIVVGGERIFPTMVWGQCADGYANSIAAGINVFMENPCESLGDQVARLNGHGFVLADAWEPELSGINVIGSYLPDEWDTFLPGNLTIDDARELVPQGALSPLFLTLTNHFYSGAAPLPQGRGDYAALVAVADVLGFDLYPLQNWCRTDAFGAVYDAQRELVQLAAGKPTFQWIEARDMDCSDPALAVTPQTVRAETWLAIAGGAHGIGYFPHSWTLAVGQEIRRERQEIDALAPALLEPPIAALSSNSKVKVAARVRNDAFYVFAVNSTSTAVSTTLTIPELAERSITTLDGLQHFLTGPDGSFTDVFEPLEVRIYIAVPQP